MSPKTASTLTKPAPPAAAEPYILEAEGFEGHKDRDLVAAGRVQLRRADDLVQTDWLRYDQPTDELEARGNVLFSRGRDKVEGSHLKIRIAERLGHMSDVRYTLYSEEGRMNRGEAAIIRFQGRDRYELEDASYTTCPADQQDWVIKTANLKLDYNQQLGSAREVQIRYLDTPILYAPWMDFSLDDSRKSGFLTPAVGISDQRGLEVIAPWYWNIAPNRDATLFPRFMSKRGLQLGADYRYLEQNYNGDVALEALPNDREADRDRYRGLLRHNQRFTDRLSGSLIYERVSDDAYFTDLSSLVRETSKVNLPQEAVLNYGGEGWQAMGRIQRFQTLQDPDAATPDPNIIPYERVPQITLSGARQRPGEWPLNLTLSGELVHFDHELSSKAVGTRLDVYPSLSLPLANDYAFITPKVGWRYTQYELDRNPDPNNPSAALGPLSQTRSLPIYSLDSGIFMEREASYFGKGYLQTLEPRAYYAYIPYEDQSGLPVFDTAQSDLSLDQLFTENQFSGVDRVNDANQLTLALTTRLLETETGIERLQLTVGQRYYFTDQRVTLPGQPARGSDATDLLFQLSGQVNDRLRLAGGMQFNTDDGETVKANLGGAYRQGPGKLLNIDYRYINDRYTTAGLDQLDVSWQWPFQTRWHALGRINYSFQESRLVEGLLGFEYNAGCWSLRGVAQRLATSADQVTDAFFLQLELRGLTALGPNPLEVLKRSISGYTKSDEFNLP